MTHALTIILLHKLTHAWVSSSLAALSCRTRAYGAAAPGLLTAKPKNGQANAELLIHVCQQGTSFPGCSAQRAISSS